ncbi:MAG: ATP-binding cassette domain-containing protein, partial [Aeromicrobium sp.]|uniref:ATP-binding cassette domain-containing protein n=1 Tax=Aeromicrobium sp. TaxID=1871063 RepID=UPI0039E24210
PPAPAAPPVPASPPALRTPPGGGAVIGRDPSCDLVVDDPMASRAHARLTEADGQLWIEDLGSTNATLVNGGAVRRQRLVEGDQILIGNTHLVVEGGVLRAAQVSGLVVRHAVLAIPSGKRLVDDMSFEVSLPSVVAVVGPSGAGKSSLLRLLTGQERPTSGVVDFRGASMVSQRKAFRGEIGVVPQYTVAHSSLTARAALDYTARLRLAEDVSAEDRRARVAAVLDQLGLAEHADTQIARLSGGQQRRVAIAMEMLTEPSMLILDEPTSGLDPSLVLQIMQILRGLADAGKQVLVVTHDLEHLDLVDHVLVLRTGGTIAYSGPPDGIFAHFGRDSWAEVFQLLSVPAVAGAGAPAPQPGSEEVPRSVDVPTPPTRIGHVLRHAATVGARHLRLVLADRVFLALLVGMPVVLAVLALAVPGSDGLGPTKDPANAEAARLLVLLVVGAAFLGLAGAIRDLVGERPIFHHERDAGLAPTSYLLAKVVVLSMIAVVQAATLVLLVLVARPGPEGAVLVRSSTLELLVAVCATAVCCVMLGLAVSARVGTTEQTMPPLVLLVMGQLVLSGGLFPIAGRAVLPQLAWFSPTRWGYGAAASTTDLNVKNVETDPLWDHEALTWLTSVGALGGLTLVFTLLAWRGVSRRVGSL